MPISLLYLLAGGKISLETVLSFLCETGTPNQAFGGPGVGTAGESGAFKNDLALGNLLIVSEDEDASDPDDNVGGILKFSFANPMILSDCVLVDNEENAGTCLFCLSCQLQTHTQIDLSFRFYRHVHEWIDQHYQNGQRRRQLC